MYGMSLEALYEFLTDKDADFTPHEFLISKFLGC